MTRLFLILSMVATAANAQCVMCFRTAAAQQLERARIMNVGILIMLVPPVLILAGFLFLAWRRNVPYDGDVESTSAETNQRAADIV